MLDDVEPYVKNELIIGSEPVLPMMKDVDLQPPELDRRTGWPL
jgi:hypothetical protein